MEEDQKKNLEEIQKHLDKLSDIELKAFDKFREARKNGKDYPIAPITQGRMFQLYLNGHSCEEIQKLNSGFSLGQIVDAYFEGKWEQRRQNHINRLLANTRDRVIQAQSESVEFMADLLTVAHKLHGEKIKKYIQSGDPKDLGDLNIDSLEQYRKAVDVLMKLTGQGDNKKVSGSVTHHHVLENPANKPLTKEDHSKLLAELAIKKE